MDGGGMVVRLILNTSLRNVYIFFLDMYVCILYRICGWYRRDGGYGVLNDN